MSEAWLLAGFFCGTSDGMDSFRHDVVRGINRDSRVAAFGTGKVMPLPLLEHVQSRNIVRAIPTKKINRYERFLRGLGFEPDMEVVNFLYLAERAISSLRLHRSYVKYFFTDIENCVNAGVIESPEDIISLCSELLKLCDRCNEKGIDCTGMLAGFLGVMEEYGNSGLMRSEDISKIILMDNLLLEAGYRPDDILYVHSNMAIYKGREMKSINDVGNLVIWLVNGSNGMLVTENDSVLTFYFLEACAKSGTLKLNLESGVKHYVSAFNNLCEALDRMGINPARDYETFRLLIDGLCACAEEGMIKSADEVEIIRRFIMNTVIVATRDYWLALGVDIDVHLWKSVAMTAEPQGVSLEAVLEGNRHNPWSFDWIVKGMRKTMTEGWIDSKEDVGVIVYFISSLLFERAKTFLGDKARK